MLQSVKLMTRRTMSGGYEKKCGWIGAIAVACLEDVLVAQPEIASKSGIVHEITMDLDQHLLVRMHDPLVLEVVGTFAVVHGVEFEAMASQYVTNCGPGGYRNEEIDVRVTAKRWVGI